MVLDNAQLTALLVPAPPEGSQRDIDNPPSRSLMMYIMGGVCGALLCFSLIFRYVALAKRNLKRHHWWLEANIVISFILTLGYIVLNIIVVTYPALLGVHVWDQNLDTAARRTPLLVRLVLQSLYPVALFWTKFCLLLIYIHMYRGWPKMRRTCIAAIVIVFVCHFGTAIVTPVTCAPMRNHGWLDYYLALDSDSCHTAFQVAVSQSVFNVVTDVFLLVIGLPGVLSIHMPAKQVVRVLVMILTCAIVVVGSALGIYFRVYQIMHPFDNTWELIPTLMASIGELTAGFMVLCVPAFVTTWRSDIWQHQIVLPAVRGVGTDSDSVLTKVGSSRQGSGSVRSLGSVQSGKARYVVPVETEKDYLRRQALRGSRGDI